MEIQNRFSAANTLDGQQTMPGSSQSTGDFAAALSKATADKGKTIEEKMREEAAARAAASKQANNEAVNALQDYMSKPLAQHMREAILKEMGLTEEDVKAMPPEKQQTVEAEISRRIRERMLGQKEVDQQGELSASLNQLWQVITQAQSASKQGSDGSSSPAFAALNTASAKAA